MGKIPFRLERLLDQRLKLGLGNGPHNLVHDLAILEEDDGRDTTNPEFARDAGVLVDIHLADLDLAVVIVGNRVNHRGNGLAGGAPCGPEVNQHGYGSLQYFILEIIVSEGVNLVAGHYYISFTSIDIKIAIIIAQSAKKSRCNWL